MIKVKLKEGVDLSKYHKMNESGVVGLNPYEYKSKDITISFFSNSIQYKQKFIDGDITVNINLVILISNENRIETKLTRWDYCEIDTPKTYEFISGGFTTVSMTPWSEVITTESGHTFENSHIKIMSNLVDGKSLPQLTYNSYRNGGEIYLPMGSDKIERIIKYLELTDMVEVTVE